jgi:hypothetical protein
MKKRKKKNNSGKIIILIGIVLIIVVLVVFFQNRKELNVVSVVEEIEEYNYYLSSNSTRLYKKYYKELEEELKDNKFDEEKYAKLVSELFIIDYYTLDNKVTNKDIGGVQFLHSNLKDSFIDKSINSVYKYVKSNLYKDRKQKLPEVNDVEIISIENTKYNNKEYKDDSGYKVTVKVGYVKDYNYPEEVTIYLIHENNKLVIVEID